MNCVMRTAHRPRCTALAISVIAMLGFESGVRGQCPTIPAAYNKGKVSRNYYINPYAVGSTVKMVSDYFNHNGGMDMVQESGPAFIVAAADGIICDARDHLDDCGCTLDSSQAIGGCGNRITIVHANGEQSGYLHFQQFSIRGAFGVSDPSELIGTFVAQGDIIGIEGDVGRTCNPNGPPPRWGTCISEGQAALLGPCGRHLHWSVRRINTGELVNPMTCNIPFSIYRFDDTYQPTDCGTPEFCTATADTLVTSIRTGFGTSRVHQNADSITANSYEIKNQASIVFHAQNSIHLMPGFKAGEGDGYFRAEIGPCNETAQ